MISRMVQSNLAPAWSRYRQVLWGSGGFLNGKCHVVNSRLNIHMDSLLRQSSCSGMWTAGWDCAKLSLNKTIQTLWCCIFKSMVHDIVSLSNSFFSWRGFMSLHVGLRITGSRLHIIRWKMMNTMAQVCHCQQIFDLSRKSFGCLDFCLPGPLLPDSVPWLHRQKVDRPCKNAGFIQILVFLVIFGAIKSFTLVAECKWINQFPADFFGLVIFSFAILVSISLVSISVYICISPKWCEHPNLHNTSNSQYHHLRCVHLNEFFWGNVWALLGFGWPETQPFVNFDLSILLHTWCLHEIPKLSFT